MLRDLAERFNRAVEGFLRRESRGARAFAPTEQEPWDESPWVDTDVWASTSDPLGARESKSERARGHP